jgi:hypothetical protein
VLALLLLHPHLSLHVREIARATGKIPGTLVHVSHPCWVFDQPFEPGGPLVRSPNCRPDALTPWLSPSATRDTVEFPIPPQPVC